MSLVSVHGSHGLSPPNTNHLPPWSGARVGGAAHRLALDRAGRGMGHCEATEQYELLATPRLREFEIG